MGGECCRYLGSKTERLSWIVFLKPLLDAVRAATVDCCDRGEIRLPRGEEERGSHAQLAREKRMRGTNTVKWRELLQTSRSYLEVRRVVCGKYSGNSV